MPIEALEFYIVAKYEHETIKDNYFADMAMLSAAGNVKEPDKLQRYHDTTKPKEVVVQKQTTEGTDVFDVIAQLAKGE